MLKKVTAIPIVVGALKTIPKNLEQRMGKLEIRGRIETVLTTEQLRSVRILRRVLESCGDLLSFELS